MNLERAYDIFLLVMSGLALPRFPRLKLLVLQWDILPPSRADFASLLSRKIRTLITPHSTNFALKEMEIRFRLRFSHTIVETPCILDDLDAALVSLHVSYPAMTLRLRFQFHTFVTTGARGNTSDILSLLRPVVQRAVASGLQLHVTTVTTVFLPGNLELETVVQDTDLSS